MNTTLGQKLLTALMCSGLLVTAGAAQADDDDRHDRGWRHHKHAHKHHKHYYRGHEARTVVIRERVVIREAPRHYRHREVHNHYYGSGYEPRYGAYDYRYSQRRDPAVVIGFDIPSIVIPLR